MESQTSGLFFEETFGENSDQKQEALRFPGSGGLAVHSIFSSDPNDTIDVSSWPRLPVGNKTGHQKPRYLKDAFKRVR